MSDDLYSNDGLVIPTEEENDGKVSRLLERVKSDGLRLTAIYKQFDIGHLVTLYSVRLIGKDDKELCSNFVGLTPKQFVTIRELPYADGHDKVVLPAGVERIYLRPKEATNV